jgi:hypothetical protein
MAVLTDYTTFSDIRTILGVSIDELPDSDLELETYLFGLESALDDVGTSLIADYAAVTAPVVGNTATAEQIKLYRATRLYSALQVCENVSHSLPMRAEKSITDGKAGASRFTDSPIEQTIENMKALLAKALSNLQEAYAENLGTQVTITIPSFLAISVPSIDPVTG